MTEARIAVVILAAGTSSRLGRPKQLLELDGQPLIRHTVRNAITSRAAETLLVVGSRAEEIAEAVRDLGQRTVVNPHFAEGQSTSMVAGISALGPDCEGAILMLGDQPTVGPDLLDALIEAFCASKSPIVQSRYQGRPGNPVLFRCDLFPELLEVTGDLGAREIIQRRRRDVEYVDFDRAVPPDVDSDADYDALKAIWANR